MADNAIENEASVSEYYLIKGETLASIGNAIREKTGEEGLIAAGDMADAIGDISTGAELPPKGVIFEDFDEEDQFYRPKRVYIYGYQVIPNYFLYKLDSWGSSGGFFHILDEIKIELTTHNTKYNTYIESYAFRNNQTITKVKVSSDHVFSIEDRAFYDCTAVALYDFSLVTTENNQIPILYSSVTLQYVPGCIIRIPRALSDQTLGTGNGWESATNWCDLPTDTSLSNYVVWEVV